MTAVHARKFFVHLAVRDLSRTREFFRRLGFSFDPRLTTDDAACMIVGEGAYVMLLTERSFKSFTKKALCDTRSHSEGLFAVSCASREEVDTLVKTALAAGARPALAPIDHGVMYSWSFYDLDDHHWEFLWMNPSLGS